jgi:hypothetical protein
MIEAIFALGCLAPVQAQEEGDFFDWARKLDDLDLTWQWGGAQFAVSGQFDLEAFIYGDEAPGVHVEDSLLRSDRYDRDEDSDNPDFGFRLRLFLDGSYAEWLEWSIEGRLDGTTGGEGGAGARFEQYWARLKPFEEGQAKFQLGKFAAPVGNFIPRSSAKKNPLTTWPLAYDHVTSLTSAGDTAATLSANKDAEDLKDWYVPIWQQVYATGVMAFGDLSDFTYAVAFMNSAPGTLPEDWDRGAFDADFYNLYLRAGYRLDARSQVGMSWSRGPYEKTGRDGGIGPGPGPGPGGGISSDDRPDQDQTLFGFDASFTSGFLELFGEFYWTQFESANIHDEPDLWTWYLEGKYQITPELHGALRLAQMYFGEVEDAGGNSVTWDRDVTRVEFGGGYLFTTNFFVKVTQQLNWHMGGRESDDHMLMVQLGLEF